MLVLHNTISKILIKIVCILNNSYAIHIKLAHHQPYFLILIILINLFYLFIDYILCSFAF